MIFLPRVDVEAATISVQQGAELFGDDVVRTTTSVFEHPTDAFVAESNIRSVGSEESASGSPPKLPLVIRQVPCGFPVAEFIAVDACAGGFECLDLVAFVGDVVGYDVGADGFH